MYLTSHNSLSNIKYEHLYNKNNIEVRKLISSWLTCRVAKHMKEWKAYIGREINFWSLRD